MRQPFADIFRVFISAVALVCACWPALGESAPLPKLAVSVSRRADLGATLTAIERCGGTGSTSVVAPTLDVDFGDAGQTPLVTDAAVDTINRLVGAVPSSRSVFLHVRIHAGARLSASRAQESALGERAAQLVAALPLNSALVTGVILEVGPSPGDLGLVQFTLATLVLQLKAAKAFLGITVVFPPGLLRHEADLARRVTAYADAIGVVFGPGWRSEAEWVRDELRKPVALDVGPDATAESGGLAAVYLDALIETGDTLVDTVWAQEPTAEQASLLCRSIGVLSASLGPGFASGGVTQVPVSLTAEGDPLVAGVFVDSSSPDVAFLVKAGGSRERPRRLTVTADRADRFELTCHDALDGRRLATSPIDTTGQTPTQDCNADTEYAVLSVRRGEGGQRAYESVNVTGRGDLRVEEIIARWQQYRAAQKRDLDNYTAHCLLTLHFEPTTLGSGFDIALQLRQFVDRTGQSDWVQTAFFVNGVRFASARGFPLPQLEPEKVVTQPLELALDEKYRYTLLGTDTVDGTSSYVIGVEPEQPGAMLFSGKVWIDGLSFRQVRMQLQQSGGRSNILSHVETQDYELVPAGGGKPFNLLRSVYVQQMVNAAGRSFLLEKTYRFSDYQINASTFESSLAEARGSDLRMFRDTDEGLRVLRREGGTRVVEPPTSRIRSLLMGVMYEGTFDFPIPLAGLSLVDFDVRKTGAQLSVFFAGPVVAANLSKPVTKRLRFGVDVALSAIPQNNRVYVGREEIVAERVWTLDETVGVLANWQALPSVSLGGSSYFSVNLFRPTKDTAPDFLASGHGFTVQTSGEVKIAHRGFTMTATGLRGTRIKWRQIGYPTSGAATPATTFLKYSGEFSKQFYFGNFSKAAVSAGYYGGDQLDRFSRYLPSFLSRPRIRGIPSGTDSFDAVGVTGVLYGFNVLDVIKVEGMYNRAWGQNLDESRTFKTFDGLELDLGTVGPWGTFLQGTVTYALRGNVERYNNRWGVYLLIFRPLGH